MVLLTIELILKIICIVLPLLIAIAYFTLAERKIMAAIQRRKGPNVVGFLGLLQPLADGVKLILKETTIPSNANKILFNIAPILTFFLSLLGWAVIPFGDGIVLSDINLGIMYIFAISALGVYGVIIAGWSSNSKYAFLGALRSAAQMISYELTMGFIIINIVIMAGSFNLSDIVNAQDYVWYAIPQLPMFGMFFVCALAETNRHPFDLMEAEAELVSGFNVEYSAVGFAMFFLGEYGNILLMCSLMSILFLGGWKAPIAFLNIIPGPLWFGLKVVIFVVLFIWVRAAFPRYRYDQLMRLGWKIFLPLSFAYLVLTASVHVMDFSPNKFYETAFNPGNYIYSDEILKIPVKASGDLLHFIKNIQYACINALSHSWYSAPANQNALFESFIKTYAYNFDKLKNITIDFDSYKTVIQNTEFLHYLNQILEVSKDKSSLNYNFTQDLILHFKLNYLNEGSKLDLNTFYEGKSATKFLLNFNKLTNSHYTILDLPYLKQELNLLIQQQNI